MGPEQHTDESPSAFEAPPASTLIALDTLGDKASVREASFEHAADPESNESSSRDSAPSAPHRPLFSRRGFLALAAAHVGQYGWIDKQGEWAIEPQYGKAASFSEGLAGFMDPLSEKWGYLDKTGAEVIAPVFADARLFKAGLAACQDAESKQWGFIDQQGAWAIEPKFEHAGDFAHGLAPAQDAETGKFGYIDDTGYWVIPPQYLDVNLNVME